MVTDLLNLALMLTFMGLGLTRPWVAMSGAIWVDLYKPQLLSQSFLYERPLSLVMTAFLLLSIIINLRKVQIPRSKLYFLVVPGFMLWITLTTLNAQFPDEAWVLYDASFKTILLAYLIPFVVTSRKEVELFVWVLVGTMGFFIVVGGGKSLLGGGGYEVNLITSNAAVVWNEGSTLATQAISLLPLLYFVRKSTLLVESMPSFKWLLLVIGICGPAVLVGTEARTGLVALAGLVAMMVFYSRSRIRLIVLIGLMTLCTLPLLPDRWMNRMTTISDASQESSAQGRIVVWRWTLDYVKDRPFMGGGFKAYLANSGQLLEYSKENEVKITETWGKAFHNIFLQVLGEHGYVGLLLFVTIIGGTLLTSRRIYADKKAEPWRRSLSKGVFMSMAIYCIGGMFIGVAYYPWIYYMYGLAVALIAGKVADPDGDMQPVIPEPPARAGAPVYGAGRLEAGHRAALEAGSRGGGARR